MEFLYHSSIFSSERLAPSAGALYQGFLLSNDKTEISCVEVLQRLLGAREDLGPVARSVLFSVVVLVIEGRRLDARGGFSFGCETETCSVRRFGRLVHNRRDILKTNEQVARELQKLPEAHLPLVASSNARRQDVLLDTTRCEMVQHRVVWHIQDTAIILHGSGSV